MKKQKKILLVSSAFYPENSPRSFRATELAKEFNRQGHQVTVITRFRDYDYSGFLKNYPIGFRMWYKSKFPHVPSFQRQPFSFLSRAFTRLFALLFEYPAIEEMFQVKKILKNEKGSDLLISFAVPFPVQWGVAWARSNKAPIADVWAADCGDPFMFNRLDTFRKPFYFKFLEKYFCKKCDYITIPYEELKTKFYPEFSSKIVIIPQGINFEKIRLFEGQINNDKPVLLFAGSIIPGKRDLKLFLSFLSTLSKDFQFIIYTNQMQWFEKYKLSLGTKIELRDYIDRFTLFFEMSKADFLVNIDTAYDTDSNIEAVPSKLIDYAISNRPILNIEFEKLDEEKILEFFNKDYSRQRIVDKSKYDIKKVVKQFFKLIE